MIDATLIADLVRAGVDADLIGRVANAVASATVRGLSADNADKRREQDRLRKRETRAKSRISTNAAKANDVAVSADVSADNADKSCILEDSKKEETEEKQKENKKVRDAVQLRRGTRLSAGCPPTDADIAFAKEYGYVDAEIKQTWAEFVDYWVGVPGVRGVKLDWPATWRNRIRKLGRKGPPIGVAPTAHIGFYAEFGSPELEAWDAHKRRTEGKTLPRDKRGGWIVPARWPPDAQFIA